MNHKTIAASMLLATALALLGCDKHSQTSGTTAGDLRPGQVTAEAGTATDRDFLGTAAQANLAEVDAGKLATKKAASPDVKKFAQMMIDDHTAANAELLELARKKNIALPTEPDGAHQKAAAALAELSGTDFDRKYMTDMVKDHETAVSLFEKNASRASDADIRAFASKTLPTLRHHLDMAREVQGKSGRP